MAHDAFPITREHKYYKVTIEVRDDELGGSILQKVERELEKQIVKQPPTGDTPVKPE